MGCHSLPQGIFPTQEMNPGLPLCGQILSAEPLGKTILLSKPSTYGSHTINAYRVRRTSAAERSYPTSKVRGSSPECQAATAQEQPRGAIPRWRPGWWLGGATPGPRSGGCPGKGGPRGATPRSRSGGEVVRRYRSSKVRETQVRP